MKVILFCERNTISPSLLSFRKTECIIRFCFRFSRLAVNSHEHYYYCNKFQARIQYTTNKGMYFYSKFIIRNLTIKIRTLLIIYPVVLPLIRIAFPFFITHRHLSTSLFSQLILPRVCDCVCVSQCFITPANGIFTDRYALRTSVLHHARPRTLTYTVGSRLPYFRCLG